MCPIQNSFTNSITPQKVHAATRFVLLLGSNVLQHRSPLRSGSDHGEGNWQKG